MDRAQIDRLTKLLGDMAASLPADCEEWRAALKLGASTLTFQHEALSSLRGSSHSEFALSFRDAMVDTFVLRSTLQRPTPQTLTKVLTNREISELPRAAAFQSRYATFYGEYVRQAPLIKDMQ